MKTELTRDVMIDLLPAYLSGEASDGTRSLIEAFMKEDPGFAQMVRNESSAVLPLAAVKAPGAEPEMAALRKAKRILKRRAWNLAFALLFTGLTVSYQFGPEGFKWTWQDQPATALAFAVVAIGFWIAYFQSRRRLEATGI